MPAGLLVSSAEIFGHPAFTSADSLRLFFMAVGCDDEESVTKALFEWLKVGHKFPTPADIRALIVAQKASSQALDASHA